MAEGKGIRKTAERSVATSTAKPPLTLEHESSTELANIPQGDLQEVHSKTFTREAQRLDEKIVKTIDRIGKDLVVLGEMFQEMQDKGYHRALGYGQFVEYIKARYPDHSRTQILQAMRIVRELTSGDNPTVSKDDVREMSRDNAEGLVKLKKQGREITPELIEQAKTLPVYRFEAEVVQAQSLDLAARATPRATEELQVEVQVKRSFYITGTTNANLDKAIEIIEFLGEGLERDKGQSKDDYIVGALVGDFLATYAKDYEEMMAIRDAKAIHAATLTEDKIGPEPASEGPEDEEEEPEDEGGDKNGDDEENDEDDEDDSKEVHVETAGESAAIAICNHTKDDGVRCGAPAVKNGEYCYFHKKHYAEGARQETAATIH